MSHELTLDINGKAEMAYVGDDAWHGKGQKLQENAPLEVWANAAGMEWSINRAPIQFQTGDYDFGMMKDKHVLFRSDTKAPLGVVSDRYKVVQPIEVLEFFRDLVAGNGFKLNTAGTLFGGKRMWALASIGEEATIIGNQDRVGGFLLLSTACDGTMATEARFTTVRVVCNNTLGMARSMKDENVVKISHRENFNAKRMHDQLGIATDKFAEFMQASRKLASVKLDDAKAREFLQGLMFDSAKAVEDQSAQAQKKVDNMLALFNGQGMGANFETANGTAWGLVNAVTEFVDHHSMATKTGDARLNNRWFDTGADLKTEAFEKALLLA